MENDQIELNEDTKFLEAFIEKDAGGVLTAVASTNTVDRRGEIVDNNGWDLKAFKKNPILLWGHDHSQLPIGVSKKTWVEGTGKQAKLMIQPEIHEVTPTAMAVKELINRGILKTLSVGFRPLESPDGTTFTKNELLEVSVVNVPANADAMMLAYKSLEKAGFEHKVIESLGIKASNAALKLAVQGINGAHDTMASHIAAMAEQVGLQPEEMSVKDDAPAGMINNMKGVKSGIDTMTMHLDAMAKQLGLRPEEVGYTEGIVKELGELNTKLDDLVKAASVNPKHETEETLSLLKGIAKASDKVLEAENKQVVVDRKRLVKAIKRASEILIVAEKDKLNG